MNIKVLVEPGEDGYFVAHVPALKSCWSQGKTKAEALENIREAIDLYLEHQDGRVIVFPLHNEVDRYTLKGALRDADIQIEEFLKEVK
ncbi:MAG: type II toxin-antitoxin system HicB family antitoxin [Acidobacteriota bacterium]